MARINIILPIFNAESTLTRCMDSIFGQTFNDYKVIAVNDGSTDNSLNILENYQEKYKGKLEIINQSNQGVAKARKNALENIDSQYVAFIDSDDYIDTTYLEILHKCIEETKTNISCARFALHINKPILSKITLKSKPVMQRAIDLDEHKEFLLMMQVVTTAKLYRREFVKITKEDFRTNEDLSTNYLSYVNARHISFDNSATYHYHPTENSLSKKNLNGYTYDKIVNTLAPLQHLKNQFTDNGLYIEYYYEIEALYIKNIFQRINYIAKEFKNEIEDRDKLIDLLLQFLQLSFPCWQENPYYKDDFKIMEITDVLSVINANKTISKINITYPYNSTIEEVIEEYKAVSSKIKEKRL